MSERVGVVLMNLGGPDSPAAVEPFLYNLFRDPAIIRLPWGLRHFVAWMISRRRAPLAQDIYARLGGRSPILPETEAQAQALEARLKELGMEARCVIAMRYWQPFAADSVTALKAEGIDRVVLLPLYPQFSTTTTASSVKDWLSAANQLNFKVNPVVAGCYPRDPHFTKAYADRIRAAAEAEHIDLNGSVRLLFSAHGLPERIVAAGDPYPAQIEASVHAIVESLGCPDLDVQICYQSRVGPMTWIGPSTDDEIARAGKDGKGIILVPVSFVSEHSETLVELDIEYRDLAAKQAVPFYVRVPALGIMPKFIEGLARQVIAALDRRLPENAWRCPTDMACACRESDLRSGIRQ
ncbi:ferrochelatase [Govanella unica]|uniref:Ferrochelatase n=1 Tax=Govanella unica TaxID=2975056 RepID=A0A9X3TUB3_9PROT|nr:ferrochelatase [Govania unica]